MTDDIQTPNPWRHLHNVSDDNELTPQTGHGKKKARSPLDDQAFTKNSVTTKLNVRAQTITVTKQSLLPYLKVKFPVTNLWRRIH